MRRYWYGRKNAIQESKASRIENDCYRVFVLGQKSTRSIENTKMLSRNPNVAFAIYDRNNPYDMVSVRGKVVEQVNGDAAEKYGDSLPTENSEIVGNLVLSLLTPKTTGDLRHGSRTSLPWF